MPGAPQNPYLILHYLLASWPAHWWVFLERFQHAFQQDNLWRGSLYDISGPWEKLLEEGECWGQTDIFGERITSSEVLLARQLRSPKQEDLVSPLPWEDLTSVISRVARNMRYEDPTWLLISQDAPRLKIYSLDVPVLRRQDDYRLLGLDREGIYRLTLHCLAPRLQRPAEGDYAVSHLDSDDQHVRQYLDDTTRRRYCASLRDTKVCPACLEEEIGYDRL